MVRIILNKIEVMIGKKNVQLPRLIRISPGSLPMPSFESASSATPITIIEIPMIINILASVSNKKLLTRKSFVYLFLVSFPFAEYTSTIFLTVHS